MTHFHLQIPQKITWWKVITEHRSPVTMFFHGIGIKKNIVTVFRI